MTKLPALLTVGLFVAGLAVGIAGYGAANPGPPPAPYDSLPKGPEPAVTANIMTALKADDPHLLASVVQDPTLLKNLGDAIQPLVEVTDVTFEGATALNGETLVGYVATGRNSDGQKLARGFVLHVQNDKVVGVN